MICCEPAGKGIIRKPMYRMELSLPRQRLSTDRGHYAGHIDGASTINTARRRARRFLQYRTVSGYGAFIGRPPLPPSEGVAGSCRGISLASLVAPNTGHVTQICVSPAVRGTGIGHELLRQSLITLRGMGCASASLTVTAANEDAVSLYERVGFQTIRQFSAYVWEGF
jgi:ribosomal protein S18 acetylase RimI-like enzyme